MDESEQLNLAGLKVGTTADGILQLQLTGRLDAQTIPALWERCRAALREKAAPRAIVDATGVSYCDGAGVAMLLDLRGGIRGAGDAAKPVGTKVEIKNL